VQFDLLDRSWPQVNFPVRAMVSSLTIHHLEGLAKLVLFREVFNLLAPGGVFLIADLVEPAHPVVGRWLQESGTRQCANGR